MEIRPGELFEFKHPISGIIEMWEAMNVIGARVELKAITGSYANDLDRSLSARPEQIIKYRSPTSGPAV
jgi:hypothetical protein